MVAGSTNVRLKAGALNEGISLARRVTIARIGPVSGGSWRVFVATLALIAFAAQSYLTQTHIHPIQAAHPAAALKLTNTAGVSSGEKHVAIQKALPNNKSPVDDDPLKCPLCQAVGYAGHFVTPSAVALLLPNAAISVLPLAPAIVSLSETPSHIWQGRGPPRS